MDVLKELLLGVIILAVFIALLVFAGRLIWKLTHRKNIGELLRDHFPRHKDIELDISGRSFPLAIRADVCRAIEEIVATSTLLQFVGLQPPQGMGKLSFTDFLSKGAVSFVDSSTPPVPPQFEYINIGEEQPVRTLCNGLWLVEREGLRLAILYAPANEWGNCGVARRINVEIAVPGEPRGIELAARLFEQMEGAVQTAKSYRGKVLSFEDEDSYSGQSDGVKVHALSKVDRNDVILPAKTVELLERNLLSFVQQRQELRKFGMAAKKGLLFYGPPGTGKTHTIRYLAGALEGHTTLLITAEQVGNLGDYMTLARLLQPSIVVMEDVDLIARNRTDLHNPQAELLLNKLLNEMDGLREDCEVIFLLTTNRPEELEHALASRPGRIDQAIEFPLPDAEGRRKLVALYGQGIDLSPELVEEVVDRTEKVTASFIKELMRRAAQFRLERNGDGGMQLVDIERALDEMLLAGGSLNLKLLGASERLVE